MNSSGAPQASSSSGRHVRIPYDTHAWAGQGDYTMYTSPLMAEHAVPLEMLQRVYLNKEQLQRRDNLASTPLPAPSVDEPVASTSHAAPNSIPDINLLPASAGLNDIKQFPVASGTVKRLPSILDTSPPDQHDLPEHPPIPSTNGTPQQAWLSYTPARQYPPVRSLPSGKRKRILVTGGAGFVGSHLVDRLMFLGHDVTVLDNFFSGAKTAVAHWAGHPNFELVRHDVTLPFHIECDMIYHLACPASPRAYQYNQIKTMKTNFLGTLNMLGLAKRTKARFLLSSTSEVYGSPEVHPQPETYWGNVNPIGPRACYDEGKRVAEALTFGYLRQDGVDVRIARIFNTFGPRMTPGDGRVVSNFILQALRGDPITIYGDGSQTRSLLFVQDLVDGLILLMNSECTDPVNIGSPYEGTILSWAKLVIETVDEVLVELSGGDASILEKREQSKLVFKSMPEDDPPRRRADTTKAQEILGWSPRWTVKEGLKETIRSFVDSEHVDIDLAGALRQRQRNTDAK